MDDYLAISALQHYAYCPRQFAFIHVEQVWAENRFTAEGQLLHQRVDSSESEQRGEIRYERSVSITSHNYKLKGKMDLLEVHQTNPESYFPVEYKRGKPKIEEWDKLQLCAQALCIEEMRGVSVEEGAIWYWETRQRLPVLIDSALRDNTINAINAASSILESGITPAPTEKKIRCRACSLKDICEPSVFRNDKSAAYIAGIGE